MGELFARGGHDVNRAVHLIWPHDIDDPLRPTGGDRYDRELASGLADRDWTVSQHVVEASWPDAGAEGRARLARIIDALPDGALVVIDGLIGSAVADVLEPRAGRLRLVLLVHLPTAEPSERVVVKLADHIVTTSEWSRRWLRDHYGLDADRVDVARPGVTPCRTTPPRADGRALVCVGAITPLKGHDVLIEALRRVDDLLWRCRIVGSAEVDAPFAGDLRRRVAALGLSSRIIWAGPVAPSGMDEVYAAADLLVAPSRFETYGMAITEALAHGLPVIGTAVGGVPEAFGQSAAAPGVLVEPGHPGPLAAALRRWLTDPGMRAASRAAAIERGQRLPGWERTVDVVDSVLRRVCDPVVTT